MVKGERLATKRKWIQIQIQMWIQILDVMKAKPNGAHKK